jgi:GNAT superfamily N-acetyltransferase
MSLRLVEYTPDLAPLFHDINAAWIEAMFALEPHDREVLTDPETHILATGGTILFVEAAGRGIVGTCALMPNVAGGVELTKMGVLESARGLKAGAFLLSAAIDRAAAMPVDELYLLTNQKCAAAIHLYEKAGFVHDADIMARFGGDYARCDVAMSYALTRD